MQIIFLEQTRREEQPDGHITAVDYIDIYPLDEEGEWWNEFLAKYRVEPDGSLTFMGSCFAESQSYPQQLESYDDLVELRAFFRKIAKTYL